MTKLERLLGEDECFADQTQKLKKTFIDMIEAGSIHPGSRIITMPAGYTYLGQFLAHELVSSPDETVTWHFDMNSVYGGSGSGPDTPRDGARLVYKSAENVPFDLDRDSNGQANIPVKRNDENLLIAQFHLLMLHLHNWAVDRIDPTLSECDVFDRARIFVTITMHEIVRNDYLRTLCDETVYRALLEKGPLFDWPCEHATLPLEFTKAAFRFGHSQVRRAYVIGREAGGRREVTLKQSFDLGASNKKSITPVQFEHRVDWEQLFFESAGTGTSAVEIDMALTQEMRQGIQTPGDTNVAARNLQTGIDSKLPSGETLAQHFVNLGLGIHVPMQLDDRLTKFLAKHSITQSDLPIWLYVLLEASLNKGKRLGPLGSVMLGSSLMSAMQCVDLPPRDEFFKQNPDLPELCNAADMVRLPKPNQ